MIESRIRGFLGQALRLPHAELLASDTPLLPSGAFDSLGVLELMDFLEREFHIVIEPAEVKVEHLASLRQITAFVVEHTMRTAGSLPVQVSRGTA
jgi:acyl carrier protein